MRLTRLLPILFLFLLAGIAVCQEADTISVGADGTFEAEPDTALVQFNIGTQEKQLKDAYARARRAADQVRGVLKANSIDPGSAQVSSFQVAPIYDYKSGGKRKAVAYRVTSGVTIKLKDFEKVAPIAEAFGQIDVTEHQSIDYVLENSDSAKAKAVEEATLRAKMNADAAARVGGRQLGTLLRASVDTRLEVPVPRNRLFETTVEVSAGALAKQELAPTQEFSAKKITVSAHINAVFSMK